MVKLTHQTPQWEKLKKNIQGSLLFSADMDPSLILHLRDEGHVLEKLQPHSSFSSTPPYQDPQFIQRLNRSSPSQENLLKAIGCRKNETPSVIDATAGFGIDALLMAQHQCPVSCIEWNPLVCFMVADALWQAQQNNTLTFLKESFQYYQNNACILIPELPPHDVIYLDPMFPERRKQAKVKKYMQMMQAVSFLYPWIQQDEKTLFDIAFTYAKKRVVVKRPRADPPLISNPNHSISSQAIRFDVYLTTQVQATN